MKENKEIRRNSLMISVKSMKRIKILAKARKHTLYDVVEEIIDKAYLELFDEDNNI